MVEFDLFGVVLLSGLPVIWLLQVVEFDFDLFGVVVYRGLTDI